MLLLESATLFPHDPITPKGCITTEEKEPPYRLLPFTSELQSLESPHNVPLFETLDSRHNRICESGITSGYSETLGKQTQSSLVSTIRPVECAHGV